MQRVFLFLIILVTAACTHGNKSADQIEEPKDSLLIAYNVLIEDSTDNYEIFVMDTDGKNQRNISNNQGVDWVYYAWKDKIYFISDRDTSYRNYFLYVMDSNGENIKKISSFRLEIHGCQVVKMELNW
jgi:TolB protein